MNNRYLLGVCLLITSSMVQSDSPVLLEKILYKNCYTSYKDQYVHFENHKVFTYAMDEAGINSCGWSYASESIEQAKEIAIKSCERNNVNSPCKFIDIDGEIVVREGEFPILTPADEHKLTEEELIQKMTESDQIIKGNCLPFYKQFLTTMYGHRAFAYARDEDGNFACGMSGSGHSIIEPAIKSAIEQCEINKLKRGDKKPTSECKIYAQNYDVIAKPSDFSVRVDPAAPFQKAIIAGNVEDVKAFLSQGTDVNTTSKEGITAIFVAAATGNLVLYNLLLEKGADIQVVHKDGSNLLMAAISGKNINIIRSLLEKGLNVNKQNNDGNTSLHLGVMSLEVPIMQTLIEHGADVSKKNNSGESPQDMASILKLDLNNLENKSGSSKTVDVNARDEDGWTPLFWAAKENDLKTINDLLDQGADINARDDFGSTSLSYAINHEHLDAVKLLLEKGADIHNKDEGGETPLMDAAYKHNLEIIKFLLSKDADKSVKDKAGKYALDHLGSSASEELKKILCVEDNQTSKKPEFKRTYVRIEPDTPLQLAITQADTSAINKLLSEDIDQKNSDGVTAIFIAALIGDYKTFKLLLEKSADLQVTYDDTHARDEKRGATAFYQAVRLEHPEVAEFLIEQGAKINDRDNDDRTPLMSSLFLKENNLTIVKLLLSYDADITLKDKDGKTAFDYLSSGASLELKELIQE